MEETVTELITAVMSSMIQAPVAITTKVFFIEINVFVIISHFYTSLMFARHTKVEPIVPIVRPLL